MFVSSDQKQVNAVHVRYVFSPNSIVDALGAIVNTLMAAEDVGILSLV